MGISIVLYRVNKAEKFEELLNLEKQLESEDANSIDLYKMYGDLAIIFSNTVNPFNNVECIEYKILFGNQTRMNAGHNEVGGFIPTSEVLVINQWIKGKNINTREGFYKMYDNLDAEVKEELINMDSPDKEDLYAYVKELTGLYESAEVEGNSIIVCAE